MNYWFVAAQFEIWCRWQFLVWSSLSAQRSFVHHGDFETSLGTPAITEREWKRRATEVYSSPEILMYGDFEFAAAPQPPKYFTCLLSFVFESARADGSFVLSVTKVAFNTIHTTHLCQKNQRDEAVYTKQSIDLGRRVHWPHWRISLLPLCGLCKWHMFNYIKTIE